MINIDSTCDASDEKHHDSLEAQQNNIHVNSSYEYFTIDRVWHLRKSFSGDSSSQHTKQAVLSQR